MFLSIIIPVYNVEVYLEQCIESILKSSFEDYEIILVVGNSSDRSNEICYDYSCREKRISVVVQNGKGLSNARNNGLKVAKGDYIIYIDSDDYLKTEAFENTIWKFYALREKKIDVLISDFYLVNNENKIYSMRNQIKETKEIIEDISYLKEFLSAKKNYWNVWRYIYKRDFLEENGLYSKENSKSEDIDYSTKVILKMRTYTFFHNPYYCYRVRRTGSLVNVITMQNVDDLLDVLEDSILMVSEEKSFKYSKLIIDKLLWEYFFGLLLIEDIEENNRKKIVCQKFEKRKYLLKMGTQGKIIYRIIDILGMKKCAHMLYLIRKARRQVLRIK